MLISDSISKRMFVIFYAVFYFDIQLIINAHSSYSLRYNEQRDALKHFLHAETHVYI